MRAEARLVAGPDGRGGTRLSTVYGEPPLLWRRTGPCGVHLVGGAAGPLGGDDLTITVTVEAGARLEIRTVAASLAQPSNPPRPSRLTVRATVGAGATLHWLPEPLVAVAGCDHHAASTVDLDPTAVLAWREEIVGGRHGEPGGDLRAATTVRRGGRTLLRHDLAIGPRAPDWDGPAVVGGRVAGTLLVVDPARDPSTKPPPHALALAGGPAHLVTATGDDARHVRATLDKVVL
jgi:urease accessory protein